MRVIDRWHNHLNPDLNTGTLTAEEEKIIFQAQRNFGNKWADIAKLLKGRTDNVVKNHFYSTLRRELRKILRSVKGDDAAEPTEVSVDCLRQLIKENNVPYNEMDNENIKDLLIFLDNRIQGNKDSDNIPEEQSKTKSGEQKYSLYFSLFLYEHLHRRERSKRKDKHYLYFDESKEENNEIVSSTQKTKAGRVVQKTVVRPIKRKIIRKLKSKPLAALRTEENICAQQSEEKATSHESGFVNQQFPEKLLTPHVIRLSL